MASVKKVTAVAYMRTNKGEVGEQLDDLYMQHLSIKKFAEARRLTLVKSFDDFGGEKRVRLNDVLDYCRDNKSIQVVIAKAHTRISRNVQEFNDWESIFSAIGVRFEFVQQSVMGDPNEFVKDLVAAISKLDSSHRSEYIKRGILNRVEAGYSVQKPPMGYVRTAERGLFVKDPNTASYLHSNITRFLSGALSYEGFRRAVSIASSSDKLLARDKFRAIVTNPYYAGYVCHGGKQYKGLQEPLLTEAEHKKLTTMLGK